MHVVHGSIPVGTWEIDPARSRVGFSVRHMMVASVRGQFTEFAGTLMSDSAGLIGATGTVAAASIDTREPKRDEHLRGAEFLDVHRNPHIRFASRRIERGAAGRFRVVGELALNGVTREILMRARLRDEPSRSAELHVEADGAIMRSEFGLSWTEVLEAGGAVVGDRVRVSLDVVAVPAANAR